LPESTGCVPVLTSGLKDAPTALLVAFMEALEKIADSCMHSIPSFCFSQFPYVITMCFFLRLSLCLCLIYVCILRYLVSNTMPGRNGRAVIKAAAADIVERVSPQLQSPSEEVQLRAVCLLIAMGSSGHGYELSLTSYVGRLLSCLLIPLALSVFAISAPL
jgi:hypothetical protein